MQYSGHNFVQKISGEVSYNYRLKKQCRKQIGFLSKSAIVFAPKVINYGYEDDKFYFDMEYILAKTLAEYSESISILEISDFMRCLFHSLYWDNCVVDRKANAIFRNKIEKLINDTAEYKNLKTPLNMLYDFDWSNIYKSPCHGDLTLENILITRDKKLYLIDFLDSFYNSWMLDVAKLLQDLELKWSFRHKNILPNQTLRLQIAKEALIEEILKTDNGQSNVNAIYHLLLLNIIRIYPYAKDDDTVNYLNNSVDILMNKLGSERGVPV